MNAIAVRASPQKALLADATVGPHLGHMLEIIEDGDSIKNIFKMIADAAVDWDGRNPIRYL